jgi:hypothetical protein
MDDRGRYMSDEREHTRDTWLLLSFFAICTALLYVLGVPYREGWMYWIGVPAIAAAIVAVLAVGVRLFKRRRKTA